MYRRIYLSVVLVLITMIARTQYPFKFDNTVYKAVYLNQAFRLMDSMQNYLLLDVRSPGEYADTSRSTALNIGIQSAFGNDDFAWIATFGIHQHESDRPV